MSLLKATGKTEGWLSPDSWIFVLCVPESQGVAAVLCWEVYVADGLGLGIHLGLEPKTFCSEEAKTRAVLDAHSGVWAVGSASSSSYLLSLEMRLTEETAL